MSVSVFSPISIGNVSVGFDTLGLAVAPIDGSLVGDIVSIEPQQGSTSENEFVLIGSHASKLPADKTQNIVWQCLLTFNQKMAEKKLTIQALKITLQKKLPVSHAV